MKLHNENLQWIYDHVNEFKRALVTLDYARQAKAHYDEPVRKKADAAVHDYALTFLLMAMGEHPPKTLWGAEDYSVLYGAMMDTEQISDDQ